MFRTTLILLIVLLIPGVTFADVSFHDEISGNNIYLIDDGDIFNRKIVVNNTDNEWYRIEGDYFWLRNHYRKLFPLLSIDVIDQYYLDTINNKVVEGNQYSVSPDGKWGYLENQSYRSGRKTNSILIKNFRSGEIKELITTYSGLSLWWLNNSNLLICKYSENKKQYEIVIYNPLTGKYKDVVLGRLHRFSLENNLFLYVKNEPMRKSWVYDLKTGKGRLLKENENDLFKQEKYQRVPERPNNLDIYKIKKITPSIETKNEHLLKFTASEKIPVYFVFKKDNKTFIPIRPLFKKFNIATIVSKDKIYSISKPKQVKLTKENSIVYHNRLFVTQDVLRLTGLPEFTIEPILK